ncbi:MAG: phosphoglycerate mutase family protein [Parcubacteria group bacterium]|nr:phosphoglycerate mutase family protein [Parcubacteria group bacterium]
MGPKLDLGYLPDEIVFCRHGESVGNVRKKDDSSTNDIPNHQFDLTSVGVSQARQAGVYLNTHFNGGFPEYYVSTFLRAKRTFQLLCLNTNPTPYEDPRLDEYWRGIFHSMPEDAIRIFYPSEHAIAKREGWYHYRPPQGEAGKDVELRILSFLSSLEPHERIFICGHGQWFCFLDRILCGKTRDEARTESPKNCSVVSFKMRCGKFESSVLFEPS